MRYHFSALPRTGLFLLLFMLSAAMVYTTSQNTRAARTLAAQSLEGTALALSFAAERALRKAGGESNEEIRAVLSDRVVAYALIAAKDGTILFHTNPRLKGTRLPEQEVEQWTRSETPSGRRITLGTGTPAYAFDSVIHGPQGAEEMLRLVLHTAPADRIISRADRMWWTVGAMLVLVWTVGVLFERISLRHMRLQEEMERQRQLTLIGQMTAVLAHEIRNALGSVKGYSQWMEKQTGQSDPKKAALGVVLQGTDRIESLVNDLLRFSKEEVYDMKSFDLRPLIQAARDGSVSSWAGDVAMDVQEGLTVYGDREKLHRVMVNAVKNAMEATGHSGHVGISARLQGREVVVMVEDSGPGIKEKERPRLFTPFHTTKTDGTGLGLAYSRKLVEGMGGDIRLENRKGEKGAVLTVRLPKGVKP
ncbi:MAG: HAMP domain-containing sensor histidine kinase [Thermodesulfobacteriota bacterium]|nr:HAMP domain-containing sensor histidine kinase [Thermodesulfobacteriota bacterium]